MSVSDVPSSTGLAPRVAATLTYAGWWITGLLFWFVERKDLFVRFHAAQAIAAFGIIAVLTAAFGTLAAVSLTFLPSAFAPFLWASVGTWLAGVVLWAVVMWNAARGRVWRIPLAADVADRLARS